MTKFITEHWFLWIMLTVATILVFVWLFAFNRKKLQIGLADAIILSLIHVVYGVITVAFFGFAESGFDPKSLGSISMFGGLFFMPIMYALYAVLRKQDMRLVFDIFTPALAVTLALARVNCLYAGCCHGIEIGHTGILVPTREIELFYQAMFLIFAIPPILKDKHRGFFYPIYFSTYGVMRFITEWFRYSETTMPLHFGHIWSIVVMVIGGAIIAYIVYKNKKTEAK